MKNAIVETVIIRKPSNLDEVQIYTNLNKTKTEKVLVTEVIKFSESDYEKLANNFSADFDFLKGKGGYDETYRKVVLVYCPNKPYLVIDPEGYSYARYVGLVNPNFNPLKTENECWGCWNGLRNALNEEYGLMLQYWNEISFAIHSLSSFPAEEVRALLDSRFGRHLVDEFIDTISKKESFIAAFFEKYSKSEISKAQRYYV